MIPEAVAVAVAADHALDRLRLVPGPTFLHAIIPFQLPGLFPRQQFRQLVFESWMRDGVDPGIHAAGRLAE